MLKNLLRKVADVVAGNDLLWKPVSRSLIRGSQFLVSVRHDRENDRTVAGHPALRDAIARREILAGPFKGMKYGDTIACCSALYPKLLGTYEHELEEVVSAALAKGYKQVVDVGAADGYYAVGFALASPDTRVIAYEQNPRARSELAKLSKLNGVADRIEIRGHCDSGEMQKLGRGPGLMIVDCEGYEENLLTVENIRALAGWDFIIETHDGFSRGITQRVAERFKDTHDVRTIEVIHDLNKVDHVEVPLLDGVDRRDADQLLAEVRQHACMRWLVCDSKAS